MTAAALQLEVGSLVEARGREWVVLPESGEQTLRLRPLGGSDEDAVVIYLPLEPRKPRPARFPLPDPATATGRAAGLLLRDAMRLRLANGAGPFRPFGNLGVEPRPYQLVPLLMALRQEVVRLLIADGVGIGKTIEAELIDRRRFRSQAEARMALFAFIEGWYNPRRRHSALGYLSPVEYERRQVREG